MNAGAIHTGNKVDGKYERIQRKASGRTKAEARAEFDEMRSSSSERMM